MKFSEIFVLYQREIRSALRERSIVVNSFLIPLFMYPILLWVMFTGMTFIRGQEERFDSHVVIHGLPRQHAAFADTLNQIERLQLRIDHGTDSSDIRNVEAVRDGVIDAFLNIDSGSDSSESLVPMRISVAFNESREKSVIARDRILDGIRRYRTGVLTEASHHLGISPVEWNVFTIRSENTATSVQMGRFLLGLLLPLFFIIMVSIGCMHPAVDTTAGERERKTWETLMSSAVSRINIVIAKYWYVATFGCIAGVLNLAAMMFSIRGIMAPLLSGSGGEIVFSISLSSIPLLILGAILLSGFIAAGMMLFASFATTFKEGQSMVTPFYMLTILPAIFIGQPDIDFSLGLAIVPVVNVAMMVREAIMGSYQWNLIGVTVVVSLFFIALSSIIARFILQFEDVIIGSYSGSLISLLKERYFGRGSREPNRRV